MQPSNNKMDEREFRDFLITASLDLCELFWEKKYTASAKELRVISELWDQVEAWLNTNPSPPNKTEIIDQLDAKLAGYGLGI